MSKRKKKNDTLESLFLLIVSIIEFLIKLIVRFIIFIYDLITFFTSKYKEKSGNSFFKTYFNKGNYGEFLLYRKIIHIFGQESVLANLYLDNKNTETTEIDILAVSNKGIYVFEMKNYSGYIYGSGKDQNWTQVLNRWTKNKFYNPLKQNYAHTKAVETYLQLNTQKIVPIVVFSNRSRLSKINISENQNVFQFREALKFIRKYEKKNPSLISNIQKENYLVKLLKKCNMSEDVKIKHINQVKELQKQEV
ncbi:nuclease-related domain-containing protein [Mycoplasmatota bacterium WC30]